LTFQELNLHPEILQAVTDMGFDEPTPIQAQTIPLIMEGCDIVGQAQTGTGKTAAFGIPALQLVDPNERGTQVLILSPTRELAMQITEEITTLGKHMRKVKTCAIYGGEKIDRQFIRLSKGVQIVVGTPGRIMDHLRRGTLVLNKLKIVILDEADEMLKMGFREDIETILSDVNTDHQTLLFSATMAKEILDLVHKYQKTPKIIKVASKQLTVESVDQFYLRVRDSEKTEILTRLLDIHQPKLSVVFCNTKRKVDDIVLDLQTRGYASDKIHGDMVQTQRDIVMGKFRSGMTRILVATDVMARGIDVDDIECVFNYDLPLDEEFYVHRIGRTGRAGRTGKAFSFADRNDSFRIRRIESYAKTKIMKQEVPTVKDAERVKNNLFLYEVKNAIDEGDLKPYKEMIRELRDMGFDDSDIAAGLIKLQVNKSKSKANDGDPFEHTGASAGNVRFYINQGRKQQLRPKTLLDALRVEAGVSPRAVGNIDIFEKFTFFEVTRDCADSVFNSMSGSLLQGKKVLVEPASARQA